MSTLEGVLGQRLVVVRLGRLRVQGQAELLDLKADAFTPLNDIERQLVFCETGSSVRFTIVAGNVVFEKEETTTVQGD